MSIWVEKSSIKIIEIVIYNRIVWASYGKCVRSKKRAYRRIWVKQFDVCENLETFKYAKLRMKRALNGPFHTWKHERWQLMQAECMHACVWKLAEPSKSSNHFALIEVFSYHFWSSIHCIWKTTKRMPSSPSRHVCLSLTFISRTWWKKRFSRLCEETEYETEYNAP